jgi:hypothetical protein
VLADLPEQPEVILGGLAGVHPGLQGAALLHLRVGGVGDRGGAGGRGGRGGGRGRRRGGILLLARLLRGGLVEGVLGVLVGGDGELVEVGPRGVELPEGVGGLLAQLGVHVGVLGDLAEEVFLLGFVDQLRRLGDGLLSPAVVDGDELGGLAERGIDRDLGQLGHGAVVVAHAVGLLGGLQGGLGAVVDGDGCVLGGGVLGVAGHADDHQTHEHQDPRGDGADDHAGLGLGLGGVAGEQLLAGEGGELHRHVGLGAVDLAVLDEAEPDVAQLDQVAVLQERAAEIDGVDPDPVGAPLVGDLVAVLADGADLRVEAADGGVVDGDAALLGAADGEGRLPQRELGADGGPCDHHQPVGLLLRGGRHRGVGPRGVRVRRVGGDEDPVIPELDDVRVLERVVPRHALSVDVATVVAVVVDDVPGVARFLEGGVTPGHVPLGEPDRVLLVATDVVLVTNERQ